MLAAQLVGHEVGAAGENDLTGGAMRSEPSLLPEGLDQSRRRYVSRRDAAAEGDLRRNAEAPVPVLLVERADDAVEELPEVHQVDDALCR